MKTFVNEQNTNINFSESTMLSLGWINNAIDLRIDIDWSGQLNDGTVLIHELSFLHCKFVTDLEVNFCFKNNNMGNVSIDNIIIDNLEARWQIRMEFIFQPVGFIRFVCDEIDFIIQE